MNGLIAKNIEVKMNTCIAHIKRRLATKDEEMASFAGYLEALKDAGLITSTERTIFLTELVAIIIS